jgi:arylsulfatase A-like enzyme
MKRIAFVLLTLSIAICSQARLPNIIYILADDLGYGDLGCYGQEKIKTPNIDALAEQGMRFTQHYSGQAVCAPSRCSFLTGLHQGHAYIRNNKELPHEGQTPIPADTFTIAKMLKTRGYATACIGKWGLGYPGSEGDPLNQGFDLFFGNNCQRHAHQYYRNYLWKNDRKVMYPENKDIKGPNYSADEMRKEALAFMEQNKDTPFFLYYATPIPHVSLQVPEESLAPYQGLWPEKPFKGAYKPKTGMGYTGHAAPRAAYAAMVSHMDRNIGMLMARLDELGLTDDTLVVFTSDNGATYAGGADPGFFNGTAGLRGLKGSHYEGGLRVPFIARWPGKIAAGTTNGHVSAFWDMLPTFAAITGAEVPVKVDGLSMLPALTGKPQKPHDFLYWEFNAKHYNGGQVTVRMGDWKGIKIQQLSSGKRGKRKKSAVTHSPEKMQLFNLKTDPFEQTDVAAHHPEVVSQIEAIIQREHTPSALFPFETLD